MRTLLLSLSITLLAQLVQAETHRNTIQLDSKNTLTLRGPIGSESVLALQLRLIKLDLERGKRDYPIYLVVDSPGGSIVDGKDFIEFAQTIKNLHTVTLFAASMASAIVESLPGRRYITANGVLMFHRAAGGFQGTFEVGEVESQLAFAKAVVLSLEKVNAARMEMSLEDYKARAVYEWWIYGEDSLSAKAADEVVMVQCSDELIDSRETLALQTMFGYSMLEFSKCPLLRSPMPSKLEVEEETDNDMPEKGE